MSECMCSTLLSASANGSVRVVKWIMSHANFESQVTSESWNKALLASYKSSNIKISGILLQTQCAKFELSLPLIAACQNGDLTFVKRLLKNSFINVDNSVHRTQIIYRDITIEPALFVAVRLNNLKVTEILIDDDRIDVNVFHPTIGSPLMSAVRLGSVDMAKLLLSSHRDVDLYAVNKLGRSAFCYADDDLGSLLSETECEWKLSGRLENRTRPICSEKGCRACTKLKDAPEIFEPMEQEFSASGDTPTFVSEVSSSSSSPKRDIDPSSKHGELSDSEHITKRRRLGTSGVANGNETKDWEEIDRLKLEIERLGAANTESQAKLSEKEAELQTWKVRFYDSNEQLSETRRFLAESLGTLERLRAEISDTHAKFENIISVKLENSQRANAESLTLSEKLDAADSRAQRAEGKFGNLLDIMSAKRNTVAAIQSEQSGKIAQLQNDLKIRKDDVLLPLMLYEPTPRRVMDMEGTKLEELIERHSRTNEPICSMKFSKFLKAFNRSQHRVWVYPQQFTYVQEEDAIADIERHKNSQFGDEIRSDVVSGAFVLVETHLKAIKKRCKEQGNVPRFCAAIVREDLDEPDEKDHPGHQVVLLWDNESGRSVRYDCSGSPPVKKSYGDIYTEALGGFCNWSGPVHQKPDDRTHDQLCWLYCLEFVKRVSQVLVEGKRGSAYVCNSLLRGRCEGSFRSKFSRIKL
eukprot:985893_1